MIYYRIERTGGIDDPSSRVMMRWSTIELKAIYPHSLDIVSN